MVLRIKGRNHQCMSSRGQQSHVGRGRDCQDRTVGERGGRSSMPRIDPKTPIKSYAAVDKVVRNQIAKMPAGAATRRQKPLATSRWKQANPKLKPDVVPGEHFLMFSNLAADRAKSTIKTMETQYGHLKRLLGSPTTDWPEKLSLYVFSEPNRCRICPNGGGPRSRQPMLTRHIARSNVPQPYLAVFDPAGGKKDDPAAGKRRARSKRGGDAEAESGGADRSLDRYSHRGTRARPPWRLRPPVPRRSALGHRFLPVVKRSSRGATIISNCGKPHSPISIKAGISGLMRRWVEARPDLRGRGALCWFRTGGSDDVRDASRASRPSSTACSGAVASSMRCSKRFTEASATEFLDGTGDWAASHYGRL